MPSFHVFLSVGNASFKVKAVGKHLGVTESGQIRMSLTSMWRVWAPRFAT